MNNLYRANSYYKKNRGDMSPQKNKVSFKNLKDNTIYSLNQVECFLNNFNYFLRYVKLYKLLK